MLWFVSTSTISLVRVEATAGLFEEEEEERQKKIFVRIIQRTSANAVLSHANESFSPIISEIKTKTTSNSRDKYLGAESNELIVNT